MVEASIPKISAILVAKFCAVALPSSDSKGFNHALTFSEVILPSSSLIVSLKESTEPPSVSNSLIAAVLLTYCSA